MYSRLDLTNYLEHFVFYLGRSTIYLLYTTNYFCKLMYSKLDLTNYLENFVFYLGRSTLYLLYTTNYF